MTSRPDEIGTSLRERCAATEQPRAHRRHFGQARRAQIGVGGFRRTVRDSEDVGARCPIGLVRGDAARLDRVEGSTNAARGSPACASAAARATCAPIIGASAMRPS